jgi:undecaprenyl-diphosphatase
MTETPTTTTLRGAATLLRWLGGRHGRRALLVAAALLALHANRTESRDVAVDVNRRFAAGGSTAHAVVELVSEGGLVLLAMAVLFVAWQARSRGADCLARVVTGSVGTVAALACSEALKALHGQQRPCQALTAVDPLVACPPPGDWSLPSNHAVLAAGAAAVVILAAPRLWRLVVPLALIVAVSRVAAGVHYPHDVVDGLLLGTGVVLFSVLALRRPIERLVSRLGAWPRLGPWLLPG